MHVGAEVAQPAAAIALRPAADEFRDDVVEQHIVVVMALEGDQRRDQRARLARFDAGGEQKQQRVEVVLLRHDAVLAQELRDHRRRDAVIRVFAGLAVEARGQQRQLGGVGDREIGLDLGEAMPVGAGLQHPVAGIAGELIGGDRFPGDIVGAPGRGDIGNFDAIGNEGIEEPAPRRVALLLLELAQDRAQLLAQFDAEPDRVVPQHFARLALHHLRADVERGEQRIERRGRGVLHEAFVEAAVLDAPALALDVAVADVDLARLAEARELLVRRLRRDDARRIRAERAQAHGEAALVERMELHEAGPGFIEQDVVAEVADALNHPFGVEDRAVVGALLDDRDAERPRLAPRLLVGHQRMGADALAQALLVEGVGVIGPISPCALRSVGR